jgi:hypothetical protein
LPPAIRSQRGVGGSRHPHAASFNVSDDGNFNGTDDGTLITDPPVGHGAQALANLFGQHIASIFPTTVAGANTRLLALAQEAHLLLLSLPHA